MTELTQQQKLFKVVCATSIYTGFQCAVTLLAALFGSMVLATENPGYSNSSESEHLAAMGGLVYGASVGFLRASWITCCASQRSTGSTENVNFTGELIHFVGSIMLSGLIGYGMYKPDELPLGKFMAALAVGGAVIAIPLVIAVVCCAVTCGVCLDSLSPRRTPRSIEGRRSTTPEENYDTTTPEENYDTTTPEENYDTTTPEENNDTTINTGPELFARLPIAEVVNVGDEEDQIDSLNLAKVVTQARIV